MKRPRKTKIIATLGPATSAYATIRRLFEEGVDVFRLNFSHGTHKEHQERLASIRLLEKEKNHSIGVIVDLQGPKLRLGHFAQPCVFLRSGTIFRFDRDKREGDERGVYVPHPEIFDIARIGQDILLDDGKVRLKVVEKGASWIDANVITGGEISSHKGMNIVGSVMTDQAILTAKDKADFDFAMTLDIDWIALSFVRDVGDIEKVRSLIPRQCPVHLLTKMENQAAINNLESIIEASDAVMVARGDLGVELPPEVVPIQQKRIINACRRIGKPVVVATHMLDSMVHSSAPTRAEASDVATAVYDGADAVTLSAETAVGKHPCESVCMMNKVICSVEGDSVYRSIIENWHPPSRTKVSDAISAAAAQAADTLNAASIVTYTESGSTARLASRERSHVGILGISTAKTTARQLSMTWGVYCVVAEGIQSVNHMVEEACQVALQEEVAQIGDIVVITAGIPFGKAGSTNMMRIARLKNIKSR
ncbi:MAG: pyruvate kinase [Alphaproteobacteria bacterium GM7ARS4]|nr:pyruvate kinase [Alphaproteobacteria bacterium GM7ARS4]